MEENTNKTDTPENFANLAKTEPITDVVHLYNNKYHTFSCWYSCHMAVIYWAFKHLIGDDAEHYLSALMQLGGCIGCIGNSMSKAHSSISRDYYKKKFCSDTKPLELKENQLNIENLNVGDVIIIDPPSPSHSMVVVNINNRCWIRGYNNGRTFIYLKTGPGIDVYDDNDRDISTEEFASAHKDKKFAYVPYQTFMDSAQAVIDDLNEKHSALIDKIKKHKEPLIKPKEDDDNQNKDKDDEGCCIIS